MQAGSVYFDVDRVVAGVVSEGRRDVSEGVVVVALVDYLGDLGLEVVVVVVGCAAGRLGDCFHPQLVASGLPLELDSGSGHLSSSVHRNVRGRVDYAGAWIVEQAAWVDGIDCDLCCHQRIEEHGERLVARIALNWDGAGDPHEAFAALNAGGVGSDTVHHGDGFVVDVRWGNTVRSTSICGVVVDPLDIESGYSRGCCCAVGG